MPGEQRRFLNIAHRGANGYASEAIKQAIVCNVGIINNHPNVVSNVGSEIAEAGSSEMSGSLGGVG